MMKVLTAIVVPPHMSASGAAHAAECLSVALASRCRMTVASMMTTVDADTTVLSRQRVVTRLPWGLTSPRLPNRFRTLFYRSDIPDCVRSGQFDLVHLHNPMPAFEMSRIARACRRGGTPYVVSTHGFNEIAHGHEIYGFSLPIRLAWRSLVYQPVARAVRGAAAVLALSPADIPIVHAMGFTRDVVIVPNGVEPVRVANAAQEAAALKRLGIPVEREPGQITCMFLANHTPNKGLPVLLEAFGSLDIPFQLIIGGERRNEVDYDALVRSTKNGQRVVVTGRLSDSEVPALLRRADVFIFPTLADTLPLVIFEAMAHGLPVVASRVGGIPHQVDETCGCLVPPGDAQALAAEVKRLAAEPTLLSALRSGATARAAAFGSWDDAAEKAYAAYRAVLEEHRDARAHSDTAGQPDHGRIAADANGLPQRAR
jgi:starch synthase